MLDCTVGRDGERHVTQFSCGFNLGQCAQPLAICTRVQILTLEISLHS